jgi:hypothetical protein
MSLKNICSIPTSWTLADYSRHTCHDGSHQHLSRRKIYDADKKGLVLWLREAANRRESSVVYLIEESDPVPKKTARSTSPLNTGLSNRVGESLAVSVYHGQKWAQVMLAHINMRREESSIREAQT